MILKDKKYTIILTLVVLIVIGYMGFKWYEEKMKLVEWGAADPKFPYHEYSLLELVRVKPVGDFNDEDRARFEQELRNLPTRTTPKETFDRYIQALKDGDIEKALDCCIEKEPAWDPDGKEIKDIWVSWKARESDREYLYSIKEEGKLDERAKDLEELRTKLIGDIGKIKKGSAGELEARYKYICRFPENEPCYLFFVKDYWGDWKLGGPHLF